MNPREYIRTRPTRPDPIDPEPHELALKDEPPTIREEIERFIRSNLSMKAQEEGYESFEESEDFSEDDPDADLLSPYEAVQMALDEIADEDERKKAIAAAQELDAPVPADPKDPPEDQQNVSVTADSGGRSEAKT